MFGLFSFFASSFWNWISMMSQSSMLAITSCRLLPVTAGTVSLFCVSDFVENLKIVPISTEWVVGWDELRGPNICFYSRTQIIIKFAPEKNFSFFNGMFAREKEKRKIYDMNSFAKYHTIHLLFSLKKKTQMKNYLITFHNFWHHKKIILKI